MAIWWCNLGSYAVLLRIWILTDLRIFCANFLDEEMRLCYVLRFFQVCQQTTYKIKEKIGKGLKLRKGENLLFLTLKISHVCNDKTFVHFSWEDSRFPNLADVSFLRYERMTLKTILRLGGYCAHRDLRDLATYMDSIGGARSLSLPLPNLDAPEFLCTCFKRCNLIKHIWCE